MPQMDKKKRALPTHQDQWLNEIKLAIGPWLPEEGILFEADHFALPANGSIPPAVSSTKTFAGALIEHGIDPEKMLSAHSPRIGTMKDLQAALEKEVVTVGSN